LSQAVYDYIRSVQVCPLSGGSHSHDLHTGGFAGIYTLDRVLDYNTTVGAQ